MRLCGHANCGQPSDHHEGLEDHEGRRNKRTKNAEQSFRHRFMKSVNLSGLGIHAMARVAEFHLRDLRVLFDYSGV